MADEVDPADAAPAGCASDDSIATGVTFKTDTPTDPRYVVPEAMDLSPGRPIAYRAEGIGWFKTSMEKRLRSTMYLLAREQKATIKRLALRTPSGIDLKPGRDPVRYGPR
eukprot:2392765-Pyramimonas_sp.AAC.1